MNDFGAPGALCDRRHHVRSELDRVVRDNSYITQVMYGPHRSSAVRFRCRETAHHRMKRASVILLLVLLALMAVGPVGPAPEMVTAASVNTNRAAPKVALIVGSSGLATENYKRLANEAAARPRRGAPRRRQGLLAERDVARGQGGASTARRSSSTSATVTAGRAATATRSTPSTQNGLGLNPKRGAANTHQYFGEAPSARSQAREERGRASSATSATRAATPSRASPRARSTSRPSSGSTTTPRASSGPAPRPSSPRPTWAPPTT